MVTFIKRTISRTKAGREKFVLHLIDGIHAPKEKKLPREGAESVWET